MKTIVSPLAVFALSLAPCRAAVELLTNGDFETGTFAGWTIVDQPGGTGTFYIDDPGTSTPLSGLPAAGNPSGGSYVAVSDTSGPGTHALIQTFTVQTVPIATTLSFQLFANNWAGAAVVHPAGLDYTVGANQHARVDLLSGTAGVFDTGAGVLGNFFIGSDTGFTANGFTAYSFDISSLITAPGTYQLRFSQVDNQGVFNLGLDNVSILAVIPEPGPSLLAWSAACGLMLRRRR
jgi:hypothetical protein